MFKKQRLNINPKPNKPENSGPPRRVAAASKEHKRPPNRFLERDDWWNVGADAETFCFSWREGKKERRR